MKPRFENARKAWNQKQFPVILRRKKQAGKNPKLRVKIPPGANAYFVLRGESRRSHEPIRNTEGNYWELPYSRLNELVEILAKKFGSVILMQPVRHKQVCAKACMEAMGFECECSCLGENHGSRNMDSSWFEINDTYAVNYGEDEVSVKVISNKTP